MKFMDVYLSRRALLEIEALRIITKQGQGILNGHKRGQRFFVEHILQMGSTLSASHEKLRRLKDLLRESFLGFFSFDSGETREQREWGPSYMGKVFLEIESRPGSKPRFRAFVIDFDGTFKLRPVKVRQEG